MPDYQKGKIYELVHKDTLEQLYVGSTCQPLSVRMCGHRCEFKSDPNRPIYKKIAELENGINDVKILLLESYPCDTKEELYRREGYWIKKNLEGLGNFQISGRTRAEWYDDTKEELLTRIKVYRDNNIEIIRAKKKVYYEQNKDHISDKGKLYRSEHVDEIKEKMKEYYKNNKDKIKQNQAVVITCECGLSVTKGKISRHLKTKRHAELLGVTYDSKREKSCEIIECECGSSSRRDGLNRHKKTKKHLDFIRSQSEKSTN
jgi:hypothetical protein